jgi:ABC-type Fe2+-enterobactin transport system substrate-binding protein
MVAGISGATADSAGTGAELDDSDGKLMLLHAPRNIVSAEATARLATLRALPDPIIAFPRAISWPLPSRSQS